MKKLKFKTEIKATKEKVWKILWDDSTYRKWTSVFTEGSHAKSDWNEGSKVEFLSGGGEGMYSMIEKKSAPDFMSFKHLGVIKDGKEQPIDDETKKWSGAHENYTLTGNNDSTTLNVEMDIIDEFEDYFSETFPKALEKVRELSEN